MLYNLICLDYLFCNTTILTSVIPDWLSKPNNLNEIQSQVLMFISYVMKKERKLENYFIINLRPSDAMQQTYLQSTTMRIEEMRVKRRDAEQWMSHRLLPENLRERIRRHEQYRWQETRGVDEEHLIMNLPKDLRRDIKRHLCLALLMRVSPLVPKHIF